MRLLVALLFTVIYEGSSTTNTFQANADDDPTIINGHDAQRHQFPYMVSLQYRGQHLCGGSIISPTWIATAAHCCEKIDCRKLVVVAGLLKKGENHPDVQSVPVAEFKNHPGYYHDEIKGDINNDIAVLKLVSPLKYTQAVKPIALPFANQTFSVGWLSGWGTYIRPKIKPITLQCLEMHLVTNEACRSLFYNIEHGIESKVLDTMVCAVPPIGLETACHGDSGGPIASNGILVGITSWGLDCDKYILGFPSVFTAVSKFTTFIKQHVTDI